MSKYLLLKLAEEAGEVVVAAVKHRIKGTAATKRELEWEIGDFMAVMGLLVKAGRLDYAEIDVQHDRRYMREATRMKGKK